VVTSAVEGERGVLERGRLELELVLERLSGPAKPEHVDEPEGMCRVGEHLREPQHRLGHLVDPVRVAGHQPLGWQGLHQVGEGVAHPGPPPALPTPR